MKFKYIGKMPTETAGIICKPGDPPINEDRPHIIKQLKKSVLFEPIPEKEVKIKEVPKETK